MMSSNQTSQKSARPFHPVDRLHSRTRSCGCAVFLLAVLLLAPGLNSSRAQDRGLGLGVIFGEPTGISGKYWLSSRNAVDGGLAWSFRRSGYLHLHGDYLWHFTQVFPEADRLVLYAGPGGRIGFAGTQSVVGIRMVGGATYFLPKVPMDVFIEIAPVLDLLPETSGSLNGGIGIRYFFP
ncbi:MAG TPA: hypothetical protein VEO56_03300 [Bacteroidota bacterium]|nr:hypothetical protein [Bacteroidota bacterium]